MKSEMRIKTKPEKKKIKKTKNKKTNQNKAAKNYVMLFSVIMTENLDLVPHKPLFCLILLAFINVK